jgi:peptidoglycan/LPS O-acetylase OafA/YrhL
MKVKYVSHFVKFLILVLLAFSALIVVYVLPLSAHQIAQSWEEIDYLKEPLLLIGQLLMLLFMAGLIIILNLLYKFDKGRAFTFEFAKKVNWLAIMCAISVLFIIVIFFVLASLGGPGPGMALMLIGMGIVISILGSVLHLISIIIKQACSYKEEIDLTV